MLILFKEMSGYKDMQFLLCFCFILKAFEKVKLPGGTAGTISNILTIHNLGLTRMIACFSLEVSRTESKCLEEANVLPNSTVTAIIAAVPWLQMLKQHLMLFDTPWTEDSHTR